MLFRIVSLLSLPAAALGLAYHRYRASGSQQRFPAWTRQRLQALLGGRLIPRLDVNRPEDAARHQPRPPVPTVMIRRFSGKHGNLFITQLAIFRLIVHRRQLIAQLLQLRSIDLHIF